MGSSRLSFGLFAEMSRYDCAGFHERFRISNRNYHQMWLFAKLNV